MFSKALALLGAVLLCTAVAARAELPRPAAAGTGEFVAWVHLRGGAHVTFRAAGKQFPAQVGTPLLRSDVVEVPAGEFVVVKLRNGYVVKIDEDTSLAVAKIVSLDAPPTQESLASQLDRVLTREERGRAERIAGTQARLAGADSVAPQSSSAPPEPAVQPVARPPATKGAARPNSPPPRPVSRGLIQSENEEAAAKDDIARPADAREIAVAPRSDKGGLATGGLGGQTGSSSGLGGLGIRGTGTGGGGIGTIGGLGSGSGIGSGSGYGSGAGHLGGSSRSAASVTIGEVEVDGPLQKPLVSIIARRHQNELRYCYELALRANPAVAGKLALKLTLDGQGSVAAANVSGAVSDPQLGPCLISRAKQWKFPAPLGKDDKPTTAVLTFPLIFDKPAN